MIGILEKGKSYRIFLTNRFKYEGKLLDQDENVIKLLDTMSGGEVILAVSGIVNVEVL
jgi:hypothetical protein